MSETYSPNPALHRPELVKFCPYCNPKPAPRKTDLEEVVARQQVALQEAYDQRRQALLDQERLRREYERHLFLRGGVGTTGVD